MAAIKQNPIKKILAQGKIRFRIHRELKSLNPVEKVAVLRETRNLVIKDLKRAKEEVEELKEALNI